MSGPQLENGYTRIANELLDQLIASGLSQNQMRIVLRVIRQTYGYNKKRDDMTISQIATATGLHRVAASRSFHDLIRARVLDAEPGRHGYLVGLNKNVHQWDLSRNKTTTRNKTATPPPVTKPLQGAQQNDYTDRNKTATPTVTKPLHTKDRERQPQKTTPKDSCGGGETPPAPARKPNGKKEPGRTNETWAAYAAAYLRRYGVEPVRNQTISAQLGKFIDRVGKDAAPHIAAFYVGLDQRWYVTKGHQVGVMLTDAEKLATEWRTNRSVTDTEARQGDQRQAQAGVWQRLLDEERAKHGNQ